MSEYCKNCEFLEEEIRQLQMQQCNDCGERTDYNIPCKMIRDLDYGLSKEIEENEKYKQALDEIEEIATCKELDIETNNTVWLKKYILAKVAKILYIISKVKG